MFSPHADITECSSDGLIQMKENSSFGTECFSSFRPFHRDSTFHWQIQPWRDNPTLDLVCTNRRRCTSHPEVRADMFGPDFSLLRIANVERSMFSSSTLTCNITSPNEPDWFANASCLIDVTCEYIISVEEKKKINMVELMLYCRKCHIF